jgi:hypothetical protein
MIKRRVFDSIKDKYGHELKFIPSDNSSNYDVTEKERNNSYHYFLEYKKDNRYLPEDFSFFERAKSVGYSAWLNTNIRLAHVGSHVFQEG